MRPPQLLPGKSAYDWVMYVVVDAPVCVLALIAIPVVAHTMPVGASGRLALIYLFATIGWVGGLVLGIVAVGVWRAMKRETAAGYTTLFDPRKRNLWQLNAETGEVVRVPGADPRGGRTS
jgi:hypothetical protein